VATHRKSQVTGYIKIQVNSDRTIAVDARLIHFVEAEARRVLSRFAGRVSRVEVHLSDVNGNKPGQIDKRCLIEARPKSARPRTASAKAATIPSAVGTALGKMRRSLTTFFDRRGRPAAATATKVMAAGHTMSSEPIASAAPRSATTAAAVKPAKFSPRGPKKKGIYQARRKSWPAM
jgi:hypothetical protein